MNNELYANALTAFNKSRFDLIGSLHRNFPTFVSKRMKDAVIEDYEIKSQLDAFIEQTSDCVVELNDYIDAAITVGGREGGAVAYEKAVGILNNAIVSTEIPLKMLDDSKLPFLKKKDHIITSFKNILDNLPSVHHLMEQYKQECGKIGRNRV